MQLNLLSACAAIITVAATSPAFPAQAICENPDLPGFSVEGNGVQTLIDQLGAHKDYEVMICGCVGEGHANVATDGNILSTLYVSAGQCVFGSPINASTITVKGAGGQLNGVFKLTLTP